MAAHTTASTASTTALPPYFYTCLAVFLAFPLHAPLTTFVLDAPFGKHAWKSRLNMPGNAAWAVMEMVAPITFLVNVDRSRLTPLATVLAGLYLTHYVLRAFISPLVLAPKRAPLHVIVVLSAVFFNVLNATVLAHSLMAYPPSGGLTFILGITLWALGFIGNVYHDEILHDLRRPASRQRFTHPPPAPADTTKDGRYRIPHGGLFFLVSFPNYLSEWVEWVGFAFAATSGSSMFVPVPGGVLPWLHVTRLIAPSWAFVIAEFTSMLPRALRGHAWYKKTFAGYPVERKAAIPWLL